MKNQKSIESYVRFLDRQTERRVQHARLNEMGLFHQELLSHGLVELIDFMGSDNSIAAAARTSYEMGKKTNNNRALIDRLVRDDHSSPLEMATLQFKIHMPISTMRQWIRHRTQSVNEMSSRYVELPEEFNFPEDSRIKSQSQTNKQGSGDILPEEIRNAFLADMISDVTASRASYKRALANGVARELARDMLPVCTYTRFVVTINLRNMLHLLILRLADDAQWEIRQYANAIYNVVKCLFPFVIEAWEEHVLYSVRLSRKEIQHLMALVGNDLTESDSPSKDWIKKIEKMKLICG